jgi:hypothetical protein
MTEKIKNPFVVEIQETSDKKSPEGDRQETSDKLKVAAKEVVANKPTTKQKRQWGMYFAGMGTMLLIVAGIGGGWWWMQGRQSVPAPVVAQPTSTPIALATPLPTPLPPSINRASITVDVLNASGVKGEAGKIATQIEALGYKQGTTGNAVTQTGTTLELSSDLASMSAMIASDMKSIVAEASVSATPLKGTGLIQLTIGE